MATEVGLSNSDCHL